MSKGRRVLLFIAFFVLLPGIIVFVTEEPTSQNLKNLEQTTPTPSSSQNTCFDIRTEKTRLEKAVDEKREETLKEINTLQKTFLMNRLQQLNVRGLMTSDEFKKIKDISEGTALERLNAFAENYLEVSVTLDRLIQQKHLNPYYEKDVIALGEQLADSVNPTFAFVLENKQCFDKFEVLMAENFASIDRESMESGWGKKKTGADFVGVLNKG